jgi:SAM-dependent methyltransferase
MSAERPPDRHQGGSTAGDDYARRLHRLDQSSWRRALNVQAPYRWNIRRLDLGRTLDIGSGLGRNLAHLNGNGVGVDHNAESIAIANARGLTSYTVADFLTSPDARDASFDSLLLAHVLEHVSDDYGRNLISEHLRFLKPGGKLCLICPQEAGFKTDSTHINFVDFDKLVVLCTGLGFEVQRRFSFPFPRVVGKVFPYNEFVVVATSK